MSDANLMSIAFREEDVAWGTAAIGKYTELPFTSEGLRMSTETVASNTIRADRLTPDLRRVGAYVTGPIASEPSFGDFDPLYQALMGSAGETAQAAVLNAGAVTSVTGTNTYNGAFTSPGVSAWIYVVGFTGAQLANNGLKKVTASSGSAITVEQTLVDKGTTTAGITIYKLTSAILGTAFRSFTIEKEFTDLTNQFLIYTGMALDQWQLSVNADQIVTQTMDFMGRLEASASATAGDGANTAVQNTPSFSGSEDVLSLQLGYQEIDALAATMRVQSGLRRRKQLKQVYPLSLGLSRFVVEGTFQMYFETNTYMDYYRSFTPRSMMLSLQDSLNNVMLWEATNAYLTDAQQVAGGIDTDIIAEFSYRAVLDPSSGDQFRMHQYAA